MSADREVARGHKGARQILGAVPELAPELYGIVGELELAGAAGLIEHRAAVGRCENRLDAARHIAGEKADAPGRGDRGQMTVADAVIGDRRANVVGECAHKSAIEVFTAVQEREWSLFAG